MMLATTSFAKGEIVMISERRMKTAVKKYNDLMFDLALEFNTIGTSYSEDTDAWTLKDMVKECQYQLDMYFEYDTIQYLELHCEDYADEEENRAIRKQARENIRKLRRFIDTYKKYINEGEE